MSTEQQQPEPEQPVDDSYPPDWTPPHIRRHEAKLVQDGDDRQLRGC